MDNKELKEILYNSMLKMKKLGPKYLQNFTEGERAILVKLMVEYPKSLYPKDLQEFLNVGSGRIGNALKRLEEKKWITRSDDENDSRKTIVSLTEEGYKEISALNRNCEVFMQNVIKIYGEDRFCKFVYDFKDLVQTILICEQKENNND